MNKPYTSAALHELDATYYLPTFKRFPLAFEKGKGSRLWDVEGKEYIDALAGIAVNNLGHAHPKIRKAICDQADKLIHISNFYVSEPQMLLAKKLSELSGLQYTFFGNSGAEAVEGAMKIARKYAHKQGRGGTIMTVQRAFHGRTMATVAATGKKAMMNGFAPIPTGYCHVPPNDMSIIKEKVNDDIAGIMIEPIQGEGGIWPMEINYLQELRDFCTTNKIAFILDEIQCGMGRTGKMFAHEHYGIKPDIMPLAKALGAGVPIGAVSASKEVGGAIDYGDHGTTFGGNPLVCAVALASIQVMEEEGLLDEATRKGNMVIEMVENAKADFPEIKEIRGLGLMLGVELSQPAKPVVVKMMEMGVLANATAETVVRLVPPLNIPDEDLKTVVNTMFSAIKEIYHG